MAISSSTTSAVSRAAKSTAGQSTAKQSAAIVKALKSSGISSLSSGGSSSKTSSSSKSSSNPYGQLGSLENLTSFVNAVKDLKNTDISGINSAAKKYGASNFNFSGFGTMGADELTSPLQNLVLPTQKPVENYQSLLDINNQRNMLATQTKPQTTEDFLTAYGMPTPPKQENLGDAYLKAQDKLGKNKYQQQVNDYSAQISAITAKANADQLSITGQGRGIPEVIIGGQQAQIAKEAAIKALPIQAQLEAAQGNLAMAKENLDTWYKIASQDVQNEYQYQTALYNSVVDIATREQAAKLAEKQQQANFDRDKSMLKLEYDYKNLYSKTVGGGSEEPLSLWEVNQAKNLYGVTLPAGAKMSDLIRLSGVSSPDLTGEQPKQSQTKPSQFFATDDEMFKHIIDNATDTELDRLKQLSKESGTAHWYTPKSTDITNYLKTLTQDLKTGFEGGLTAQELIKLIIE